jgi:GWxTD domain-containing protein
MITIVNRIAEGWFGYMASATFQATLLALFVIGVLRLGRRWPPALRHAILMLALFKFLIPPMLSLPTGVFDRLWPQDRFGSMPALRYVAPAVQSSIQPLRHPIPSAIPLHSESRGDVALESIRSLSAPSIRKPAVSAKGKLFLLHLSGSLLILGIAVLQQLHLRRLAVRARPAQDPGLAETYDALCRSMKPLSRPRLLISGDNHAPVTFGAWKPVVLLSQAMVAALPLQEIRVILGHELAHHRRWDPWLAWLQVIISAVWWFNPVYWLLSRNIRSVREDCCDDMVVASGISSREGYCRTLLQAARVTCRNPMAGAAFAYLSESQPLSRRFKRIMTVKSIRIPKLAGTGMLAVFLLALLLLPGIKPRALAQIPAPAVQQVEKRMPAAQSSALPQTGGAPQFRQASQSNLPNSAPQNTPSSNYRKWLDEDVAYIITTEERNAFLALSTDKEQDSFIEQFWARWNPSFKEEVYRRLAYANEHFASNEPGWKTDRGRIYILYGKPDELESHPAGETRNTYPYEKWLYRHIPGIGDDIEIEFVDSSRTGDYRMAKNPDEKYVEKSESP